MRRFVLIPLLIICLFMVGCAKDVYTIRMTTADNMNNNSALVVMMVFAYNDAALKNLQKMPVEKWFTTYHDILNSSPGDYAAFKWELVPGQTVNVQRPQSELHDAVGLMMFANFAKPKAGKAMVKNIENLIVVTIGENTIEVDSMDADDETAGSENTSATPGMDVPNPDKDKDSDWVPGAG